MKKYLIILFIVSFFTGSTSAQNLDSLLAVWQDQTQPDSTRVIAYYDYIWDGFLFSNPDSALVLIEDLYDFGTEQNYPNAFARGYNLQGIVNNIKVNYPLALELFEKSVALFEKNGEKKYIAGPINNIGLIYHHLGNYPRALEYFNKSLAIRKEIGDKRGIAGSLNNLGLIYRKLGDYSKAGEYYKKSLVIKEEIGDKRGIVQSLNNIGVVYSKEGNHTLALEYHKKSLALRKDLGDIGGLAVSFHNIGNIYKEQGNFPLALEYHAKSLASREEADDYRRVAGSLHTIGEIYLKQGKTKLALSYCQRALNLAEEIDILLEQKEACKCLYDTYKARGMSNEALVYLEKLNVITDSLKYEETVKELNQMEFAQELLRDSIAKAEEARLISEAHEEEVRMERQTRNWALGGGLLFLLLAGGFFSRWRYVRKSREIISKEKDRSENLLLNILPVEIAKELKEKGRAKPRNFERVSILFTDFKDFTEQSAKLSAEELVREINHSFEAFDHIVEKYGIEKIKTLGDSYMAAGGLPIPTDSSVKNTVLAALEMQAFISKRKAENDAEGKPAFEMRVGIHTGPVVAGIVGVKKFQYDIWGDAVNTASRLETRGEVGKVNVSHSTYELVKDEFDFEYRGEVEAKGKGKLKMYFVSRKSGDQ